MEDNNQEIQGTYLFDSILFKTTDSLEKFLDSINFEQSVYVITKAIEFSHSRGIYNMDEVELLNKSLRIINKEAFNYESTNEIRTNIEDN